MGKSLRSMNGAILFPLVTKNFVAVIMLIFGATIGACILVLPAISQNPISKIILPNALALGNEGDFPFALALTASISFYAGIFQGLLMTVTAGNLKAIYSMRGGRSTVSKIISLLFSVIFMWSQINLPTGPVEPHQISYAFFNDLRHSRIVAMYWCEAMFFLTAILIFVSVFDITTMTRGLSFAKLR